LLCRVSKNLEPLLAYGALDHHAIPQPKLPQVLLIDKPIAGEIAFAE
jgi:hypothetical protein